MLMLGSEWKQICWWAAHGRLATGLQQTAGEPVEGEDYGITTLYEGGSHCKVYKRAGGASQTMRKSWEIGPKGLGFKRKSYFYVKFTRAPPCPLSLGASERVMMIGGCEEQ